VQSGVQGWSSSDTATTATPAVQQQNSVPLYNDVRLAGLSPASSLSAMDLPSNAAVYRTSVLYQQVILLLLVLPFIESVLDELLRTLGGRVVKMWTCDQRVASLNQKWPFCSVLFP